MKEWYRFIFIIIIGFYHYGTVAQIASDCIVNPQPPVLLSVSIDPETGVTELQWSLSPSPEVVAYIVHKFRDNDGTPVDTIYDPQAVKYSYHEVESKYYRLSYTLSAWYPNCESILSNFLSTIFINSQIDTCRGEILLEWNGYDDFPRKVTGYEVQVTEKGSLPEVFNVDPLTNSFILDDFETDTAYYFVVRALLEGGGISSSGKDSLTTFMQRPPGWINADYATVTSDGKIELSYSIDPASEIKNFRLEKKSGYEGSFGSIAELYSDNGKILYIDDRSDIKKVHFYRLSALNNCDPPVITSNLSSNIVLQLSKSGSDLNLSWNPYRNWQGTPAGYRVLINRGNGYTDLAFVQHPDTLYSLSYNDVMNNVISGETCFRVVAAEEGNPHGINGESISAEACLQNSEAITVPDLFTPDGDMINDLFKPVLSFVPVSYRLVISDRRGRIVFETASSDESWDGSRNGAPLPGDVYLWFLKTIGPSGHSFSKTGTITIYRNR